MQNLIIGVISFLPEAQTLREKRLSAVQRQLDWIKQVYPGYRIIVVAQGYSDSDYSLGVEYIKYEKSIGPGPARNVILEEFYNSEYDWLLLCDDDTICYEYYDYKSFMRDIAENQHKFIRIDAVSCIEPEYYPFKKSNYEDPMVEDYYRFVPRELNSGSALSIIRNIRKYYGKKLFFEPVNFEYNEGREDIRFLCQWVKEGLSWYKMTTWIRKSMAFNHSSIFGSDTAARDSNIMQCLKNEINYLGIEYKPNGKIDWSSYNSLHNRTQKNILVKRQRRIKIQGVEIPVSKKEKLNGRKKLF